MSVTYCSNLFALKVPLSNFKYIFKNSRQRGRRKQNNLRQNTNREITNGAKNENKNKGRRGERATEKLSEDKESKGTGESEKQSNTGLRSDNQIWLVLSDGRYLCQHHAASTKHLLASLRFPDIATNYYKWYFCLEKHRPTLRDFSGNTHITQRITCQVDSKVAWYVFMVA